MWTLKIGSFATQLGKVAYEVQTLAGSRKSDVETMTINHE
jgi:hypothetical protein